MSCSASCSSCASFVRSARIPACTRGCSVFTRPSSISGKPVTSSTGVTSIPASRSVAAVPPEETNPTPSSVSPRANSTTPVLSYTANSARRTGRTSVTTSASGGERSRRRLLEHADHPSVDPDAALDQRAERGREQAVLDLVDPGLEGVPVVVGKHVDGLLEHDRPMVDLLVHEVHGDPGDLHAPRERVGDGRRPGERGQERRVHVHHASFEGSDELRSEEHTSELQSQSNLVCRLLLEKK